ncbi:hypothetical protein LTR94_029410, partial [Friedmanniomyces endolithicus]
LYHITGLGPVKPYLGAGVNYTIIFKTKDRLLQDFKAKDTVGPVLQGGVDIALNKSFGIYFDAKKIFATSDTTWKLPTPAGLAPGTAKVKLDPLTFFNVAHPFKAQYDNFIGGRWVAPVEGRYFDNSTPITGEVVTSVARSSAADVELALDAAHRAKDAWGQFSPAERALVLNRIADRMEENLELLATAETWDNGKPIRETLAADIPLAIDHFRYFAGCIRAQEGGISEIDHDTVAYHFHEPL